MYISNSLLSRHLILLHSIFVARFYSNLLFFQFNIFKGCLFHNSYNYLLRWSAISGPFCIHYKLCNKIQWLMLAAVFVYKFDVLKHSQKPAQSVAMLSTFYLWHPIMLQRKSTGPADTAKPTVGILNAHIIVQNTTQLTLSVLIHNHHAAGNILGHHDIYWPYRMKNDKLYV